MRRTDLLLLAFLRHTEQDHVARVTASDQHVFALLGGACEGQAGDGLGLQGGVYF